MQVQLNCGKITLHPVDFSYTTDDLPLIFAKYLRLPQVRELKLPYVNSVIIKMLQLCSHNYKKYYVDVKVNNVEVGDNPANGLWHLDSSVVPDLPYENFLYLDGDCSLTDFDVTPRTIETHPNNSAVHKAIASTTTNILKLPNRTIVQYDGTSPHRSTAAVKAGKRLLVRLLNTDKLLPNIRVQYKDTNNEPGTCLK